MPAYLVIEAQITDPQGFAAYAKATPGIVSQYGGQYMVMGGEQQSLEGEHSARTVISCWPDRAAALAYWHSSEYAADKPLREGTGQFRVQLVDGITTSTLTEGNSR